MAQNNVRGFNYDIGQVFLDQPFYNTVTWTNTSGAEVTVYPGRLFGQIAATALVLPNISSATDGSEQPYGVFGGIDPLTLANGDSAVIQLAIKGRINENKLILGGSDTLSTLVRTVSTGGGTLGALITKNTEIIVVPTTTLTGYDNTVS